MFDEVTVEDGATKWNVCCYGYMTVKDGMATIR